MSIIAYIAVMAVTTYLVRMIPFTVFRKQIKSRFVKSVLFYLPYAVLTAMTVPAIFYSTGNIITAVIGTVVAIVTAYFNLPLIAVAVSASVSALIAHFVLLYI